MLLSSVFDPIKRPSEVYELCHSSMVEAWAKKRTCKGPMVRSEEAKKSTRIQSCEVIWPNSCHSGGWEGEQFLISWGS